MTIKKAIESLQSAIDGHEIRTVGEIKHNELNINTMISKKPFEMHFYPSEIGKTVFLTKSEAQVALDRMEGRK